MTRKLIRDQGTGGGSRHLDVGKPFYISRLVACIFQKSGLNPMVIVAEVRAR